MTDTRPIALEKAKHRAAEQKAEQETLQSSHATQPDKPPSTGFESERERAKQALRNDLNASTGQNVQKFAATVEAEPADRILRVAAYCRVSTDDIDQVISIELQKNNYRDMIKANPKWKYAGTYVDDGFSGTNTEHRPAFRLMMRDALAGKFDMIITKSVSRFARNLLDCIGWVRKLQEHDPPIPVFFEQENLNTLATTSNIILFVLAMVAEEESHMKSEAMLLSLEWRLSRGRFITPKLLGYDRVEVDDGYGGKKKLLVVNEDQARTVRLMYYMLLAGSNTTEIADTLTDLGRETSGRLKDGSMNTHWSASGVTSVMRNERYCGDVLARKTYTPSFRNHKAKKNRGAKNKYYQPAHHEAIVTRAQWNAAQRILNSHRYSHSGGYKPMQVIDHGALCGYISVNRSWAGFEPDEYYRVSSIAMGLTEGELEADLESEELPESGHRVAGLTDDNGVQRIARELSAMEKAVKAQLEGRQPDEATDDEIKPVREGFQVVSGEMFSHAFEPVVRFTRSSISFNSTCIAKLNKVYEARDGLDMKRCPYVEMLINPVERMLIVRPSDPDHQSAVRWAKNDGTSKAISASAFNARLFNLMDWDDSCGYRIPAVVQNSNGHAVLLFDLDNYIGIARKKNTDPQAGAEKPEIITEETEDTKGIYYGTDDEEPQEIADLERLEEILRQKREIEKRSFGTPVFAHNSDIRLINVNDDMDDDFTAEAKPLDEDHRVADEVVEKLHSDLQDALYTTVAEPEQDHPENEGDAQ